MNMAKKPITLVPIIPTVPVRAKPVTTNVPKAPSKPVPKRKAK
jgi:hypothetical protein